MFSWWRAKSWTPSRIAKIKTIRDSISERVEYCDSCGSDKKEHDDLKNDFYMCLSTGSTTITFNDCTRPMKNVSLQENILRII